MKSKFLATVAVAALLVAASGAQAAPYAYGSLSFTNLSLTGLPANPAATVTSSAAASYLNLGSASPAAGGSLATGTDVAQAFAGTSAKPGENLFAPQLLGGAGARGDARITGALATGATADVVAEGRLPVNPGTASSNSGTSTGITFQFNANTATTLTLSFDASSSGVATTDAAGEGASGQVNASFTIRRGTGSTGTTVANFAPAELNFSFNSVDGLGNDAFSSGPAPYTFSQFLSAGTYNITLTSGVQVRLDTSTPAVPEPASMMLLGAGLLGLGLARRRRA